MNRGVRAYFRTGAPRLSGRAIVPVAVGLSDDRYRGLAGFHRSDTRSAGDTDELQRGMRLSTRGCISCEDLHRAALVNLKVHFDDDLSARRGAKAGQFDLTEKSVPFKNGVFALGHTHAN